MRLRKEIVHTMCDECGCAVDAPVMLFDEVQKVRGVDVKTKFAWPVCPKCGNKIAVGSKADANYRRLYDEYRRIPSGDEIRAIRKKLGLTQRQFADLLGVSVASVHRYEAGALPSEAHTGLIMGLLDPAFLKSRITRFNRKEAK